MEGRHPDRQYIEPEIQVFTKSSASNLVRHFPIRGGNNPHVGMMGYRVSHRAILAVLQKAQDFRLNIEGNVRYLIEEQSAALHGVYQTWFVRNGAREGSQLMSEQLTLEDLGRDVATVQCYEWLLGTGRNVMDFPRDQFFSRARFPFDEHWEFSLGNAINHGVEFLHGR